jgi:hypothetical protein
MLDTFIGSVILTIRCITRVIQKFAFFLARRAFFRGRVFFERISAIGTFPAGHGQSPPCWMLTTTDSSRSSKDSWNQGFQDSFQVRGHNLPCGRNLRYARYLPCGRNLLQLPFGAYMPCRASNIVYLQRITQSKLLLITRSKLLLFSLHPLTPGTLNPFQQYEIMLSRVHADYKILLQ